MGFLSFLTKTKPTNLTQTKTETLGPEQQSLFAKLFPKVQQFADTDLQQYGGSGVAGFNPTQLAAHQSLLDASGVQGDLANRSTAAHSMLLDPDFMLGQNQYLTDAKNAITGSVTDDFLQRVLPGVRSGNVTAGGMYSGGASKAGQAEGLATSGTGTGLARQLSQFMYDAYNRGLTGMGQAVGQTGQVQQQQLIPGLTMAGVGEQERALEQARLDEEISKFYTGQMLPFLQAQELLAFLQGMPGGSTTSTVTGQAGGPSLLNSIIGAGTAGLGAYFGMKK